MYEANPWLTSVIAQTAGRYGFKPEITHAVLGADDGVVDFYVDANFTISSLGERATAERVAVPRRGFVSELERVHPTYLMVDIEGSEASLLSDNAIPRSVRAVCVELHPTIVGQHSLSRMLAKLITDGFALDLAVSHENVAFLSR